MTLSLGGPRRLRLARGPTARFPKVRARVASQLLYHYVSLRGDTICISPASSRADWALIGSAEAEWQAGFQVGTWCPVRPGCRRALRPPALSIPE